MKRNPEPITHQVSPTHAGEWLAGKARPPGAGFTFVPRGVRRFVGVAVFGGGAIALLVGWIVVLIARGDLW